MNSEDYIKNLEVQLEITKKELQDLKDKTYKEISKNSHVYILKCDGPGYKIGKTKNSVEKRRMGLQTGNVNDIEIMFDCETNNADLLERIVHDILSQYRCKSNREFFDCDLDYIKMIIEYTNTTFNTMKSTFQYISKEELHHIYTNNLENIKQKYYIESYKESTDENYKVFKLLRKHFCFSQDKKDFVKLKDIKLLLKENGFTKLDFLNIVKDCFPDCEYYDRKHKGNEYHRRIFINLHRIN